MCMTAFVAKAQSIEVFFADHSGTSTNIRNAPNGKIVAKVPADNNCMLTVERPSNGWWVISGNYYEEPDGEEHHLKGAKTFYVHSSCIGIATRNYGGETLRLRSTPNAKGKVVYSFKEELVLHPVDVKNGWVKVKTDDGKHEGWIEEEWLCGNSVTNCC